ncbi:putative hydrolase [Rhizoctonia solani 123E]|uniref:Putative hydrolase n=1 Tax=Rhizoctonia solani 123E TaxID=1423351 RepID=A0A074RJJ3_9AGAM|nr:putative hydrolase [Rhizoctonia solani 123E]
MPPLLGSLLLGAAALVATANAQHWPLPEGYHRFAPRAEGFKWGKCDPDKTSRECSWFEVPLDWADSTAGKASLAVARYKATKQPKLGTIFVNPGGPGGSGVSTILGGNAPKISEAAGGQYDIVSWDPRGIGHTIPRAECFATGTEENLFWEGTIPRAGLEARGNFTDQVDIDAFYEQVDEVDVLLEELGKRCVAYSPDTFQYIGTAAAVRDMIAMHDLLEGPDKPINFWGLSYGTVIGIYFVNMFPERVGRVVLDGVVDPERWANKPSYQKWDVKPESTDEAFTGFVTACAAAGPAGCAIATKDSNPETIRKYVSDLIDSAYAYKRKLGPKARFGSSRIRSMIYSGMYGPANWPKLAEQLATMHEFLSNATSGSQTKRSLTESLIDILSGETPATGDATTSDEAPDYAFQGVTCADAIDAGNTTTKDVFDFLVHITRTVSPMFGPQWGDGGFYCHRWPVRAVERYTGPWNKKLANPILVIGNEADPVTPYVMAKKVADALGDSAILIQQDDYGHTSLAMHSNCTISALQDYFLDNKLPTQDILCGTDQQLFPGPGVTKQSLNKLNAVSNSVSTNGTTTTSTLQGELDKARERSHNLFIATIALAAASGLLLVGLLFSCIRGRHKSNKTRGTYIPRAAFEKGTEEQGHTYDDPYAPGAGTKSGGYARVET